MTTYDCRCRRHEPPAVTVLPSERLFDIDPASAEPATAQEFCARWMREREKELAAQEKRRARKVVSNA